MNVGKSVCEQITMSLYSSIYDHVRKLVYVLTYSDDIVYVRDSLWTLIIKNENR